MSLASKEIAQSIDIPKR